MTGIQADRAQGKRGRKAACESRAVEIRTRLLAWKQTPEPQRISLRALASEIGASHQLLSFHLQRLDEWQMKEYEKKAREITARASAENRPMTVQEEQQCVAYGRASLASMADSVTCKALSELRKEIKRGKLRGNYLTLAKFLARKGYREAQKILNVHFQRNNLPEIVNDRAKPFRSA